jgi:HlyD family secretion protein/adhesin transport system membrane fusion protein
MGIRRYRDSNRQLRLLAQSAVLEEAATPYMIRTSMLVISLTVIAFLVWSAVTHIKEVARTSGEIVPSGYVQALQHLEGGIVSEILVQDDEFVRRGQVLVRLSGEKILADYERLKTKQILLQLKAERLRAFARNSRADFGGITGSYPELVNREKKMLATMREKLSEQGQILQEQITQKQEQLKILQREKKTLAANLNIALAAFKTEEQLYRERLIPEREFLNALKEKNERLGGLDTISLKISQARKAISEYRWRLQSLHSTSRQAALEELSGLESEIAENEKLLGKLHKQTRRLEIRAPVDGIVKGLEIHTVGGVIAPGTRIMEIVPTDKELMAEVRISPRDIGHVKVGFPATVKISSYDFSRYGSLEGRITGISATTFTGRRGEVFYKGNIKLRKNYLGGTPGKNVVMPGMIVNADIITGEKSLLAYLLKPIHVSLTSAFRER